MKHMQKGQHNNYFWFQSFDDELSLDWFLREFNDWLLEKFVCVTAFDSGPFALSIEEKQAGWTSFQDISISPEMHQKTIIPTAGFDEWYVFSKRPKAFQLSDVFVNYSGFLLDEELAVGEAFWQNIALHQPEIYLADGEGLTIVTANEHLKREIVFKLSK